MKLRQKLAVVLASTMVASALPVVTIAASKNSLLKPVQKIEKNEAFRKTTTANALTIKFEDHEAGDEEEFYLELKNAEWDLEVLNAVGNGLTPVSASDDNRAWTFVSRGVEFTYTLQGSKSTGKVMAVKYTDTNNAIDENVSYHFPLLASVKSGDISVTVKPGDSTITETKEIVFATTSDKALSVAVDDSDSLPAFYTKGEIAPIVIEENYVGAITQEMSVTAELQNTDFEFSLAGATQVTTGTYKDHYKLDPSTYELKFEYGFTSGLKAPSVDIYVPKSDKSTAIIVLGKPAGEVKSYGQVKISGLNVKSTLRKPEQGKLLLDFSSSKLSEEKKNVAVATISDYKTTLEMKDEKAVEIVAGQIEDVEFKLAETISGTFVGGRDFEIEFTAGKVDYRTLIAKYSNLTSKDLEGLTDSKVRKLSFDLDVAKLRAADLIDDEYTAKNGDTKYAIQAIEFERENNDEIIPNKLIVTMADELKDTKNDDEKTINFKLPFSVGIEEREVEKIEVAMSGRAIGDETLKQTAVTVKNPIEITSEAMTVKVGLKGQVGGSVTIKETAKAMLNKGDLVFAVKDIDTVGIAFDEDVTLETTGAIKKAEISTKKEEGKAIVSINRTSSEASAITVKDFNVTVDRTVPEGSYDLEISGAVFTEGDYESDKIVIKDFIVVGTPNTEDMTASNGLTKGTSTFVIGEDKYTMNGVEYTMNAKSYIQNPGYTMVPVRYVAKAFGVSEENILFANGKVTIFAGGRTIQLTSGSAEAIVNGVTIPMGTKVMIKEGRTYAPVGEVARILGITTKWNSESKTATFENK